MSDDKNQFKPSSMEDVVEEIREKILKRQIISEQKRREFLAWADRQSPADPFKKAVAEDLSAIHYTINSLLHYIELLYISELANKERSNQLYNFILSLPEVTQNQELKGRMTKEWTNLNDRIRNLVKKETT
jgi:hypothetical protein